MNQCDGCNRGLPLVNGIHRGEGYDLIGCTADRYKTTQETTMEYVETLQYLIGIESECYGIDRAVFTCPLPLPEVQEGEEFTDDDYPEVP